LPGETKILCSVSAKNVLVLMLGLLPLIAAGYTLTLSEVSESS